MSRTRQTKIAAWTVGLIGLVYLAGVFVLPKEGAWIVNTANKRIQVQSILHAGYSDFSIQWPGQALDQEYAFNPLPLPFSMVKDGKLYSQYSPFFAAVSAPLYRIGGERALLLIPFLGALLTLAGLVQLCGEAGLKKGTGALAAGIAGLATPLWFYSQVFWEHTASVALLTWAVLFTVRFALRGGSGNLLALSLLGSFSVYFREETILFFVVLWLFVLRGNRHATLRAAIRSFVAFGVVLIPLALFLQKASGSIAGHHAQSNLSGIIDHLLSRGRAFQNLFLAAHPRTSTSLLVSIPILLLFAIRPKLNQDDFRRAFPILGTFALAALLIVLVRFSHGGSPMLDLLNANALFSVAPVLVLGLLRPIREPEESERPAVLDLAWKTCIGFAIIYFIAAPEISTQGMHWGCRYLLPLYPLLAFLAAANLQFWKAVHSGRGKGGTAIALLLIFACFAQLFSLNLLHRKKSFSQALNAAVRERPERVIISDAWWAPQEMYGVFLERNLFYTSDNDSFNGLLALLTENGIHEALFVTKNESLGTLEPLARVDDNNLNYFSLSLYTLDLKALGNSAP